MARARKTHVVSLLSRLAHPGSHIVSESDAFVLVDSGGGRTMLRSEQVQLLVARGLVAIEGGIMILSSSGLAALRRQLAEVDPYQAQHQDLEQVTLGDISGGDIRGDRTIVMRNRAESPLAWLRGRRGRDGRRLVDAVEFEAGERLRADFTRGQMMPSVTTNWSMIGRGATGRNSGGNDIADAALSSRMRVERALEAVGPELASLLLDVCCFLKRIEDVEQQHKWPARSGKVVLRLALTVLARHYGLAGSATGASGRHIVHWGADDYRPRAD